MPNTDVTQASLLSRVRDPGNHQAWNEFERKYRNLILRYARKRGLQQTDAEDVLQVALANLVKSLPRFVYDPQRARFRTYLYRVVQSAICHQVSRPKPADRALEACMIEQTPGDDESGAAALWEQEWVSHHYRLALDSVRQTFEPRSIEVFERNMRGESVESLARAFDMSIQAVHKVRQRIRARMQELITQQVHDEDALDG
jgi:RNA polymerase sigma-70 factor (ECF subfamily)